MTTIILTQKLLTMKLDKNEFDRIKREQVSIRQEKRKAVNSLKKILKEQKVNKTCRLCLKQGTRKIFGKNQDFDIALNIRQILGLEVTQRDGLPQHLCESCERALRQASELREMAQTTQWRLQQEQEMVAESPPDWSVEETGNRGSYFKLVDKDFTREYICTKAKCRRVFNSQEAFSEHEKLPSCRGSGVGYVCETCGRAVKDLSALKTHRLTHTNLLPFACAHCPYRGRTKYTLIAHERIHSGLKPILCKVCGASFRNTSILASHRRTHMPKQFFCNFCQRGFSFKSLLENHIASQHSDAKPYNCGICGKAYSTRRMTLRHELRAHNRPRMRCGPLPTYLRLEQNTWSHEKMTLRHELKAHNRPKMRGGPIPTYIRLQQNTWSQD